MRNTCANATIDGPATMYCNCMQEDESTVIDRNNTKISSKTNKEGSPQKKEAQSDVFKWNILIHFLLLLLFIFFFHCRV